MATTSTLLGKSVGNDRFNAEAAGWDSNPFVHRATDEAYKALSEFVPALTDDNSSGIDVLEIGCGTGLLSIPMASRVHTVVAVDAAPGMIQVLENKLAIPDAPKNIIPVCCLLEDPEDPSLPPATTTTTSTDLPHSSPRMKFDLITSHLVLHHIPLPSFLPLLKTMLGCLKPGTGQVALTDFQDFGSEAKKFHPRAKLGGVERHGIKKEWIEGLLVEAGFVDVHVRVAWKMWKRVERYEGEFEDTTKRAASKRPVQGEDMDFPFLLCMGRRP